MVFTVPLASPFLLSALPFSRDLCYLRMEFGAVRGAAVIIPLVESLNALPSFWESLFRSVLTALFFCLKVFSEACN